MRIGDFYFKNGYWIGGIVGLALKEEGVIENCKNHDNFESICPKGTVSLGGIIGYNIGTVRFSNNYGTFILPKDNRCEMYDYIVGYDTIGDTKVYGNNDFYYKQ